MFNLICGNKLKIGGGCIAVTSGGFLKIVEREKFLDGLSCGWCTWSFTLCKRRSDLR